MSHRHATLRQTPFGGGDCGNRPDGKTEDTRRRGEVRRLLRLQRGVEGWRPYWIAWDLPTLHAPLVKELEIRGSHGMPAHAYGGIFDMIRAGSLQPKQLVRKTIALDQAPAEMQAMSRFNTLGVTVIDKF